MKKLPPLLLASILSGALVLVLAILSGVGARLDWWHFRTGFVILQLSAYFALASALLSLIASVKHREYRSLSLVPFVLSLLVAVVPMHWKRQVKKVPMIHDITTDTENPPRFDAILALRKDAPNPSEYGGPEIAAQQKQAYPDLQPLKVSLPPEQAFEKALATARKMDWQIVADAGHRRIEAVDTTFWFGFKDDVVIRIEPDGAGSKIDVRSVSRVGKSDVGANAKRIRKFLQKFNAA